MSEPLKAIGISRMFDNEQALLISVNRKPTDDEIREIQDMVGRREGVVETMVATKAAPEESAIWKFAQWISAITSGRAHGMAVAICMGKTWEQAEAHCDLIGASKGSYFFSNADPLSQWKSKPSAAEIEAHYPGSQHQPDECEMCRFTHDAAKAYVEGLLK